jgi:DNA-binding beta-propeller fold protein YncE
MVTTVFGTGRATTTEAPGLLGEINAPFDIVFDSSENYLYMTDQNGGGLIRKLAVTSDALITGDSNFYSLYGVKTVFEGVTYLLFAQNIFALS